VSSFDETRKGNARVLSPQKASKACESNERPFIFPFKWLSLLQNHLNI